MTHLVYTLVATDAIKSDPDRVPLAFEASGLRFASQASDEVQVSRPETVTNGAGGGKSTPRKQIDSCKKAWYISKG